MQDFDIYIENNFGLQSKSERIPDKELTILPLYLKGGFEYSRGYIEDCKVLWAKVKNDVDVTPERLKRQQEHLRRLFDLPVIFVFEHLDSWTRKRIIEKKLAFVQPNKQLYIPRLLIELTGVLKDDGIAAKNIEHLSYPAQCALYYHLEKGSLEGKRFQDIAAVLGYSAMTLTRVVKELTAFGLVTVSGIKEKQLVFEQVGKKLWASAKPYIVTPVKETRYCDDLSWGRQYLLKCGEAGLSQYTMLASPSRQSFAIGKQTFLSIKNAGSLPPLHSKYGEYCIEIWQYDPLPLAEHNSKVVDKLSLYASLQHTVDERISGELDELINTIVW